MDSATRDALHTLLHTEPVLTIAVLVEGQPVAALLPFATGADPGVLLVQVSGLARHARGLHDGAKVGVVVHAAATSDRDPMQLPRLSVEATATVVVRDTEAWLEAAERLAARFPVARTTLALPDFSVVALELGRGRYVEGFARAVNVGPETFRTLTP
jgi:putative heme iron utilization protein